MANFGERADYSVYRMSSLYFDSMDLVISHLGFEGGTFLF